MNVVNFATPPPIVIVSYCPFCDEITCVCGTRAFRGYVIYIESPDRSEIGNTYYNVFFKVHPAKALVIRVVQSKKSGKLDHVDFHDAQRSGTPICVKNLSYIGGTYFFNRDYESDLKSVVNIGFYLIEEFLPVYPAQNDSTGVFNIQGNLVWIEGETTEFSQKYQQVRRKRYAKISLPEDPTKCCKLTVWDKTIDALNMLATLEVNTSAIDRTNFSRTSMNMAPIPRIFCLSYLKQTNYNQEFKWETTLATTVTWV